MTDSGTWSILDTTATYQQGRAVAELATDARQAGNEVTDALGEVDVGSRHNAQRLGNKIDSFRTETVEVKEATANAIDSLGNSVSAGACTAADTNNNATLIANSNSVLARDLQTGLPLVP